MKITGIDFSVYNVSDLKKSIEFYRDVLGLELRAQGEGWAELLVGNDAIVLGSWGFDTKNSSNVSVALGVDNLVEARTELLNKGVKFDGETWETDVCYGATFLDPDGNKISLHQKK